MANQPLCFISYSWDDEAHKGWVRLLAENLRESGVDVRLDQWDLQPGANALEFMERAVSESSHVLLVCTPNFREKSVPRRGGVGYEANIVTGEIFAQQDTHKFIPILRRGEGQTALPAYLRSRVYIDFRNDDEYTLRLEDLFRAVFDAPRYPRPALGHPPAYVMSAVQPPAIPIASGLVREETTTAAIAGARPADESVAGPEPLRAEVTLFHWLPIADNMLPEIDEVLSRMWTSVSRSNTESDSLRYSFESPFTPREGSSGGYRVTGTIHKFGFVRHTMEMPVLAGAPIGTTLSKAAGELKESVISMLLHILPSAVLNKLAVMTEGIVSPESFRFTSFGPLITEPAAQHLLDSSIALVVLMGPTADLGSGINIPGLGLTFTAGAATPAATSNTKQTAVLIHLRAPEKSPASHHTLGLEAYRRSGARVIQILKEVRAHAIPIRRQLAIALQQPPEDFFPELTRMKRYLTYVNVKLPVIDKIANHLSQVWKDDSLVIFKESAGESSETIRGLASAIQSLTRSNVEARVAQDRERIRSLLGEDRTEIVTLSSEVAQVLTSSLLSEHLDLSVRSLDSNLAALELDRVAKNRANALKALSVVLSIGTGVIVAQSLGLRSGPAVIVGLILTGAAWTSVNLAIRMREHLYRLVIPVNIGIAPEALEKFVTKHRPLRQDGIGDRRVVSWRESIAAVMGREEPLSPTVDELANLRQWQFEVTADYTKGGLLHAITVETEHRGVRFSTLAVAVHVARSLYSASCLDAGPGQILAKIARGLGIQLDHRFPALTHLLSMDREELKRVVDIAANGEVESLPPEQRKTLREVGLRRAEYVAWLASSSEHVARKELLGEENLHAVQMSISVKWEVRENPDERRA